MDASFWHQRWEANQIGFHESQPNPLLVRHVPRLSLPQGARVFVPLCGKTLDIGWLLAAGYRVAGVELSELAITQLFAELGITPEVVNLGTLKHYSGPNLDIFVGDIFHLAADMLGPVDAVFDRAALVALPPEMRIRYAQTLIEMTENAPQLLITYAYDQSLMAGPPFSVDAEEVHQHYAKRYTIISLASMDVSRGKLAAKENIWLLQTP